MRIYYVTRGGVQLSSVHPHGTDATEEVNRLAQAVRIPISAIRVYEGKTLVRELLLHMRGNE